MGLSRSWRNWQTHQLEGLAGAISCRFKPCRPHSKTKALEARFQGFFDYRSDASGPRRVADRAVGQCLLQLLDASVRHLGFGQFQVPEFRKPLQVLQAGVANLRFMEE